MAHVVESKKSCTVNPLKMSQPLGASLAFMGLESCMPLMHGSQGCTSFALVLLVRHFKEAIPLQTTAMNEATTIMGGYDNLEKALLNIRSRAKPGLIAICSTGLTETKGDDVAGHVALARQRHPELADTAIVHVSTPDYVGAFQDGWALAVTALVSQLPQPVAERRERGRQRAAGQPPQPGRHRGAARADRGLRARALLRARPVGLAGRPHPRAVAGHDARRHAAGGAARPRAAPCTRWPWASRCARRRPRSRPAAACPSPSSTG